MLYAPGMSTHPTNFQGSVTDALKKAIEEGIPGAKAEVTGAGGHFSLVVTSSAFTGKSMLESHKLVYGTIAPLMKGDLAPFHAIDSLQTRTP